MKKFYLLIIAVIILLVVSVISLKFYKPVGEKKHTWPLNISDCEKTDITCYQEVASNGYKDVDLCEKHPARQYNTTIALNYINRCYAWIARNTQNPLICEKIKSADETDEYDVSADVKQYCIAVSTNASTKCVFKEIPDKLVSADYWRYHCLSDLALLNQEVSLCNDLDEYHKTECYVDFAYAFDSIEVCNDLVNSEKITKCKIEVNNLKSNQIPNWIENIR